MKNGLLKETHSSQKIDNIEIIEIPNESIGNFLKVLLVVLQFLVFNLSQTKGQMRSILF